MEYMNAGALTGLLKPNVSLPERIIAYITKKVDRILNLDLNRTCCFT